MADFDKDNIMNMLGSILQDEKSPLKNIINSSVGNTNTTDNEKNQFSFPQNTKSENPDLLDTATLMAKMTDIVGKLNQTKNNREFALLSAVKPYMREERKPKIDTCLRILQVVNVLSTMK